METILLFIIFILLATVGLMYNNKQEADDRESERLEPGFLKRRQLKNRIIERLAIIYDGQRRSVDNAIKKGEKISFWTHSYPKKPGHYQVKYQDNDLLLKTHDYEILFYHGVLYYDELGHYGYNDSNVYPKLVTTTAYFDGIRYDVENVRYYLFQME